MSIRRVCELVGCSTTAYYYVPHPRDDTLLRIRIKEIAQQYIRYGYGRIHLVLKREGWHVNHKRIYRIYCEEGLNLRRKRPRRRVAAATRMQRPELSSYDECWSMDFVMDETFDGKRFRCLTVVDNWSRECMAIHVDGSIKGEDVVGVIESLSRKPKRIQVDNGSEFISKVLDKWAYENQVTLDFSRPGKPTDNAMIESFNGRFRDECLNCHWFMSIKDAREKIEDWRQEYN